MFGEREEEWLVVMVLFLVVFLVLDLTLRKCEMLLGGVGQSGSVFAHRLFLHIDHQEYFTV